MRKVSASRKIATAIGLILLSMVFLLPYAWMIGSSFKPTSELFQYVSPVSWKTFIPLDPTLGNFAKLIGMGFIRNVANTLLLSAVTVFGCIFICASLAYIFSRFEFPGRKVFYGLCVFTMMVPFEARMIPTFLVVENIGLVDTFTGLWLPWIFDAFTIMLFTNHFAAIPADLHNAALIDGCPHVKIFYKVMLPNIGPALISGGLIKFFFSWDS